jgi:hypothetical protein
MPSKSPAQAKLMRAVAHGWKPDRMEGPSRKVAKEFVAADKKAKGYGAGGSAKKMFEKVSRKVRKAAQRGDEKAEAVIRKYASKYERGELDEKSWIGKWMLEQRGQFDPRPGGLAEAAAPPARTIDPVPGREFLSSAAPPRRRAPEDIAPGFQPGRVPPALVAYLQSLQGSEPEPVKMQFGGAMNFLRKGSVPPMQQAAGRGQAQGTGGGGLQQFLRRGQVPGGGGGGGGGQFKGMGRGMNSLLQQIQQRRGGAGQGQPRPQTQGPESFRRRMPGAPGGGVPLRGTGRPPGMGGPSDITGGRGVVPPGMGRPTGIDAIGHPSLGARESGSREVKGSGAPGGRMGIGMGMPGGGGPGGVRPAVMPGRGFMPTPGPTGGGGAGTRGASPRIGMGDQQGALARATQVQTGRPPISRRQPFPGRGGPGGGFGRSRRRGRGRMRR